RQQEITQAQAFADSAAPLLATPQRFGPQLTFLLNKINNYLETEGPTPYRDAVLQVRRRVEAAQKGETPPMAAPSVIEERPAVATIGYPAPDFVTTQFTGQDSVRLRGFQGRPVLLIFYSPASETAEEMLAYAQNLSNKHAGRVTVLPLSVSD